MSETFANGRVTLYCGDCIEVLATLPAASIDSVVCDPPYHLTAGKKGGTGDASLNLNSPAGRSRISTGGFMGKCWDGGDIAFRPETWAAVFRVMKPGAHLVAFGGTRTYHRMACAIEDTGFEVRDTLAWLYGSGFPKSHDVSKGIDKTNGEMGRAYKFTAWMRSTGLKSSEIDRITKTNMGGHYLTAHSQPAIPTRALFEKLRPHLPCKVPAAIEELIDRVEAEREVLARQNRKNAPNGIVGCGRDSVDIERKITAPATAAARTWTGFGTALKPAFEPIILARKPLAPGMTVAGNVLAYGTGALNVDGCRVDYKSESDMRLETRGVHSSTKSYDGLSEDGGAFGGLPAGRIIAAPNDKGRWPANVLHDGSAEVVGLFPESNGSGGSMPNEKTTGYGGGIGNGKHEYFGGDRKTHDAGTGSAARFFYTAKADVDDRLGSKHPTVKPLDLMQWLVRLVTPPGGIVLDCFAGTGTTGEAAFREGFNAILIEREAEYQADIRRRMSLLLSGKDSRRHEAVKASGKAQDAGPLFAQVEAAE